MRVDGRQNDDLREIEIETGYQPLPDGSVMITWGETRILGESIDIIGQLLGSPAVASHLFRL